MGNLDTSLDQTPVTPKRNNEPVAPWAPPKFEKTTQEFNNQNTVKNDVEQAMDPFNPENQRIPTTPEEYDLSQNIPEKAKKFGITPENIIALGKYGLIARFSSENRTSNDRIEISMKDGDFITYYTKKGQNRTSSISIISDRLNTPIGEKLKIQEFKDEKGDILYIEVGNFKGYMFQNENKQKSI